MSNENSMQKIENPYKEMRYDFRMSMELLKTIDLYNFMEIQRIIGLIDKRQLKDFFEDMESAVNNKKISTKICSYLNKGFFKKEEAYLFFDSETECIILTHSEQTPLGVKAKVYKVMRSPRNEDEIEICKERDIVEITEKIKNDQEKTSYYAVTRNLDCIIVTKTTNDKTSIYQSVKLDELPCYYVNLELRIPEENEPEQE